jgi:signal transduction histidine kinase
MSIRARLLLIALLATGIPALLLLAYAAQDREAVIAADSQRLMALAQAKATELDARVRGTAQLQYGLARAADLATADRAACSRFLAQVREAYTQYTGIITIRPDGRMFCDSLSTGRELDLSGRDYFRRALAVTGDVVLEPTFGRLTGRAVMQVAYPVRDSANDLRFVLLASLDLARLLGDEAPAVPGARILMVDDRGQVLAAAPSDAPGLKPGTSIAETPLWRFVSTSPGAALSDVTLADGSLSVWARADTAVVGGTRLHLLAGAPREAITAAAERRHARHLGLLAGVAAFLFLSVWLLAEYALRRPVRRVSAMAERLAAGDLSARIEPPLPRGELGALMAELNQAAQSLQKQQADIAQLNDRLTRSQRLEAVGQLTGGVAHDFNNLLTVVLGNADLLAELCADDPQRRSLAEMIAEAAQRGAALTRQLLAFARRQPLAPQAIDINQQVAAFDPLLRRTLGEHIEIELVRGAGLWPAMVDAAQLQNALLNLCLNARDAMPSGGKLTLETANVALDRAYAEQAPDVVPGQYVMLAVSDTGHGIAPEHLARVFEPFFTTKEKGRGTGLGLAMVYGFAKQSGGHVSVYSEPAHGTTVKLYLPRALGDKPVGAPPAPQTSAARGGEETVLVVEDDEAVRLLVCNDLRALGYRVLQAADGREALVVLDAQQVDLLFTDVVMPGGLSGRQLADEACRRRPTLRVLYTSGYTENAIVHHGRLDPGVMLLAKPYRRVDLAGAVRAALAR